MRFGNIRFSGIFCWPNAFAYSSGSLYIMLDKFKTLRKLRFWLLPLIFLSGNRTVMIALLLLEFLTVISDKGKSTIRRILVIILGVLLLVFTSKSYFYDLAISINSEILAYSSDNYRISVLKQSFEIFKEHWLFGIGLDRFSALAVSIKNADYLVNNHLANLNIILATSDTFYTIICEVGTLGIVLWSLGIYRIFKLNKIIIGKFVLFILIVGYSDSNPLSNYYTIISYLIIIISVIKDSIKLSNVGESS
ncbi:O-antigen ligase family protein [Clostridium sp. YIM B02505]|uniref:O-antigen ligase family protein n=2 Tax=Clostridium yunnanense TaxID=2800325 RepID=A0ABS1EUM7_9CLOT|nr:O-antigen ligase family protein [Clostridium yunnanense]